MLTYDLSDVDGIDAWLGELTAQSGPLHGLVHSAGIGAHTPVRYLSKRGIEDVFRVNYTSAALLASAFRKKGRFEKPSSLVFISSVAALVGQGGLTVYGSTKAALVAMVKCMAVELAADGIRVNCVVPGHVMTPMVEVAQSKMLPEQIKALHDKHLLGIGDPKSVAQSIGFLLASTGSWITGTSLVVDGGFTCTR